MKVAYWCGVEKKRYTRKGIVSSNLTFSALVLGKSRKPRKRVLKWCGAPAFSLHRCCKRSTFSPGGA